MRLYIAIILSVLVSHFGHAQKGAYYLSQYNLSDRGLSNSNFDIVQDQRGLIYMATLKGVTVSDGTDWRLIETPYSVFALGFDDKDKLYVGGRKEIAIINQTSKDGSIYQSISKVKQEIFKIVYHNGNMYFLSENTLYIYSTNSKSLSTIEKSSADSFIDIQSLGDKLYAITLESGIQLISDNKLVDANFESPENTVGFRVSEDGKVLAYTSSGSYFIKTKTDNYFVDFNISDDGYLNENSAYELVWVNNDLIAISTISGGVVFVSATTGKVEQYMNYETGLADNEILSLYASKNHLVWCSTPQGISIIAPEMPFRNFAAYKGLSGNINVVYEFQNRVFVGTSVGLFELVKITDYEEVVSYQKVTKQVEIKETELSTKKGLFSKKSNNKTPATISKSFYKKEIKKNLLSVNYEYKKIKNIESKVVQIIAYEDKLLIGSLSGIYELQGDKVDKIFDSPMVYMYKPKAYNFLMVSTYDKEVKVLANKSNKWVETGLLNGLNDFVEQIEQGNNGELWLCGTDSVYQIVLNNSFSLKEVEVYAINNPHWDRVYSNQYNNKTYFLNSSGYYYYEDYSIKKDTVIEHTIGLPTNMLLSSEGKLWVNTGFFWYGQSTNLKSSLNFISLFADPRYISEIGGNSYWVVAGNNQLYKIDGKQVESISRPFTLFLESAQKDSLDLPVTKKLGDVDQQSSLTFKFAAPDYTNIYQTEFQYRLLGLSSEWSEWSKSNNEITFPYLPAGKYDLEVQARDVLGNIKSSESINFRILAPYWKRSWFYLVELIFFSGLMFISVLINRQSHKFSILSRLLTFLTLIFIVEFVQTIAEAKFETNQSPVVNFFIQVGIALAILPIESVLRKFITSNQAKKLEAERKKSEE